MILARLNIDKFLKAAMAATIMTQPMAALPEQKVVADRSASVISVNCIKAEWNAEEGKDYELSITPTDDGTGYIENIFINFEGKSK